MARDLEDSEYYVSNGGMIPLKWTAPEVGTWNTFHHPPISVEDNMYVIIPGGAPPESGRVLYGSVEFSLFWFDNPGNAASPI